MHIYAEEGVVYKICLILAGKVCFQWSQSAAHDKHWANVWLVFEELGQEEYEHNHCKDRIALGKILTISCLQASTYEAELIKLHHQCVIKLHHQCVSVCMFSSLQCIDVCLQERGRPFKYKGFTFSYDTLIGCRSSRRGLMFSKSVCRFFLTCRSQQQFVLRL